jgi:hypothetical protein
MRIPSSFPLFGDAVTVEIVPVESWPHGDDVVGLWTPFSSTISLRGDLRGSALEQTFFHEMIHAVLDGMGHKLARKESFVDQLASLMHQALTGAKYARKPKAAKVACDT